MEYLTGPGWRATRWRPRVGDALRRPRIRRTLDGITGAALIGLGLKLASEERG